MKIDVFLHEFERTYFDERTCFMYECLQALVRRFIIFLDSTEVRCARIFYLIIFILRDVRTDTIQKVNYIDIALTTLNLAISKVELLNIKSINTAKAMSFGINNVSIHQAEETIFIHERILRIKN